MPIDVDICMTCVSDQPPVLPLREELPSLGVEVVYRAKGQGIKASRKEARDNVQQYRVMETTHDMTHGTVLGGGSPWVSMKHIQGKLAKRKRMERLLKTPHAISYETYRDHNHKKELKQQQRQQRQTQRQQQQQEEVVYVYQAQHINSTQAADSVPSTRVVHGGALDEAKQEKDELRGESQTRRESPPTPDDDAAYPEMEMIAAPYTTHSTNKDNNGPPPGDMMVVDNLAIMIDNNGNAHNKDAVDNTFPPNAMGTTTEPDLSPLSLLREFLSEIQEYHKNNRQQQESVLPSQYAARTTNTAAAAADDEKAPKRTTGGKKSLFPLPAVPVSTEAADGGRNCESSHVQTTSPMQTQHEQESLPNLSQGPSPAAARALHQTPPPTPPSTLPPQSPWRENQQNPKAPPPTKASWSSTTSPLYHTASTKRLQLQHREDRVPPWLASMTSSPLYIAAKKRQLEEQENEQEIPPVEIFAKSTTRQNTPCRHPQVSQEVENLRLQTGQPISKQKEEHLGGGKVKDEGRSDYEGSHPIVLKVLEADTAATAPTSTHDEEEIALADTVRLLETDKQKAETLPDREQETPRAYRRRQLPHEVRAIATTTGATREVERGKQEVFPRNKADGSSVSPPPPQWKYSSNNMQRSPMRGSEAKDEWSHKVKPSMVGSATGMNKDGGREKPSVQELLVRDRTAPHSPKTQPPAWSQRVLKHTVPHNSFASPSSPTRGVRPTDELLEISGQYEGTKTSISPLVTDNKPLRLEMDRPDQQQSSSPRTLRLSLPTLYMKETAVNQESKDSAQLDSNAGARMTDNPKVLWQKEIGGRTTSRFKDFSRKEESTAETSTFLSPKFSPARFQYAKHGLKPLHSNLIVHVALTPTTQTTENKSIGSPVDSKSQDQAPQKQHERPKMFEPSPVSAKTKVRSPGRVARLVELYSKGQ